MRIKLPECYEIKTLSGKPFNINEPSDWDLNELVEIITEENKDYFSNLGFGIPDDVIKGLILDDITKQIETIKKQNPSREELKQMMKQKIEQMKQQRTRK